VHANRTLVVDADPERRSLVDRVLREAGLDVVVAADLAEALIQVAREDARAGVGAPQHRPTLAELERRYAREILSALHGNKTRAAEVLGIDRKTLYRLVSPPPPPPAPAVSVPEATSGDPNGTS
jgi:DNA-binding NtrC family response regulator